MFKRLAIYYKNATLKSHFYRGSHVFFEIYFVLLLNDRVTNFNHQLIGIFTILYS